MIFAYLGNIGAVNPITPFVLWAVVASVVVGTIGYIVTRWGKWSA